MLSIGIIAGGRGSRLSTLTASKPLFVVRGKPLISHVLDAAIGIGVSSIAIATRAGDSELEVYVRSRYGSKSGIELIASPDSGTGHAARLVQSALGLTDHIFATADVVCSTDDLAALVDSFASQAHEVDGIFATTRYVGQDAPVYVECLAETIIGYGKQIPRQPRVWGDIRVVSARYAAWTVANSLSARDTVMTADFLAAHPGTLRAFALDHLRDVDTPDDVLAIESDPDSDQSSDRGI